MEGSPEGGLPYRLTMTADATEVKLSKIVVWLHPSGGPYNEKVEELAPIFMKHRLALLVVTRKDSFQGWTRDDALKLFGVTIPEVSGIAGIDARRPILMGFSAGGQLAIKLWHIRPADYSAVILDAAYPVEAHPDGEQTSLGPPEGDGAPSVPMLVLVGAKDRGAALWRKTEARWRKAGVPLTIRYVKGLGHQWLFGDEEQAALDAWLSSLQIAGS
jgi:dienelactone hydrolase